jgi:hypothetical protein
MAWRSWNCFAADIDQTKMQAQIDALVKPRGPRGNESLLSLGWSTVGIDEGWEGNVTEKNASQRCGRGINGSVVHYPNGTPAIGSNFPDMAGLVRYAKSKGVQMGWYFNGCGCNEQVEKRINYEGDVRAAVELGFSSVKMDSCGSQRNMTLYGELFNQSGVPMAIENCHQGRNDGPDQGVPGQMGPGWCPYTSFRTSGDILNMWDRVMSNLMTVVPFLGSATEPPLSRRSCWAYADMLEVGRMPEHNAAESRSHISAWAIVSSPVSLRSSSFLALLYAHLCSAQN